MQRQANNKVFRHIFAIIPKYSVKDSLNGLKTLGKIKRKNDKTCDALSLKREKPRFATSRGLSETKTSDGQGFAHRSEFFVGTGGQYARFFPDGTFHHILPAHAHMGTDDQGQIFHVRDPPFAFEIPL